MKAPQETTQTPLPENWDYQMFRQYLLALSLGYREFNLPQCQYPETFELSTDWHQLLNRMREETGVFERLAIVGTKDDRQSLFLQTEPSIGEYDRIPGDLFLRQIRLAAEKYNISKVIGDIHSHPKRPGVYEGFSAKDLYILLRWKREPMQFLGLVLGGGSNYFVFPTHETSNMPIKDLPNDQASFSAYWMERLKNNRDLDLNLEIARQYSLVLYKGEQNQHLRRAFPNAANSR